MARLVRLVGLVAIALAVTAGPALSAGGGGGSSGGSGGGSAGGSSAKPADPNFSQAVSLIDAGKYADAIPLLQKVIEAKPQSADAFNYLGYSHRKTGDFEAALTYYQRALELQPRHLGANEYLGELYLEMGEVAKAEERLDVLDDACFFGCEEYSELKEAIKAYKTHQGAS
jgi:tetratricopeptide (TPR) repeat protein